MEKEASHVLLQSVEYHNYMQGGEITQPIFGLGVEKTVLLINKLLNYGPGAVCIRMCGMDASADYVC